MENIKKPKTFEELLILQEILDGKVGEPRPNGFTPRKRTITDILLSLDDEFQEWLRELPQEYNFKTWKQKEYSREKELEEFTDCLFFFLQYQNTLPEPDSGEYYNDTLIIIFNFWEKDYTPIDLNDEITTFKIYLWDNEYGYYLDGCLEAWIAISKLRGFTKQEILDTYWNKWKKNMERINKDWTLKKDLKEIIFSEKKYPEEDYPKQYEEEQKEFK